jgi:hypothetical protein
MQAASPHGDTKSIEDRFQELKACLARTGTAPTGTAQTGAARSEELNTYLTRTGTKTIDKSTVDSLCNLGKQWKLPSKRNGATRFSDDHQNTRL